MKKADAYREALMAGLSPDNAYEPDLVLLQEAYDQKGPEKGFDYIRDVQGQRSRKNTEVRDEWTRFLEADGYDDDGQPIECTAIDITDVELTDDEAALLRSLRDGEQ